MYKKRTALRAVQSSTEDSKKDSNECPKCQNFKPIINEILVFKTEITQEMQTMKDTIIQQNNIIIETLAKQEILLSMLLMQDTAVDDTRTAFPIKDVDDIARINNVMNATNRNTYIKVMKTLLRGDLKKTITAILSIQVLLDINVDGTHGKKRLKDFTNFFNVLKESIDGPDPDKLLRSAVMTVKKRLFHNVSIKNKKKLQERVQSQLQEHEQSQVQNDLNFLIMD